MPYFVGKIKSKQGFGTHRPSLLPIEWTGEDYRLWCLIAGRKLGGGCYKKLSEPFHLEEGEVVTRFSSVEKP